MKNYILILTLLGTLVRAYAQGVIDFANGLPHLFPPPDRLVRYAAGVQNPFGTNNAPLVGTNYHAQLYIGPQTADESSLIPVTESITTFRPVTTAEPGAWLGYYLDFPQFNLGDLVKLQVRVWDSTFGGSYEAASGNGIHGKSLVFFTVLNFQRLNRTMARCVTSKDSRSATCLSLPFSRSSSEAPLLAFL